jgi:methylenetetrahydrofolate dehydrogenase (NADP+)/methenyltetrahydrofolate cyclohydrolase
MTTDVIDCDRIAQRLLSDVRTELAQLRDADMDARLATVADGNNVVAVADQLRLERVACDLGIAVESLQIDAADPELVESVREFSSVPGVGAIVMLGSPPAHIDQRDLYEALDPLKDVDGLHPENVGLLAAGRPRFVPSTAAAAIEVLDSWISDQGHDARDFYRRSRVVIVGGVNRIATSALLLGCLRRAPVASVDPGASTADELGWYTRHADVLIVAAGVPGLIRAEHVRQGAVVLDAGGMETRDDDVVVEEIVGRARAVTPGRHGIATVRDAVLMRSAVRVARWDARPAVPVV